MIIGRLNDTQYNCIDALQGLHECIVVRLLF